MPKFYAIDHAEAVARRVARPLDVRSTSLFRPVIVARDGRLRPRSCACSASTWTKSAEGGTPDELKRLIAESHAGGQLDPGEAGMLTGVFHLHEQEARQVMTPIPAVVTRRRLRGRRDGAAAVRLDRPHAAGRHRGPTIATASRASCTPTRSSRLLMAEGPQAPIEPLVHDAPIVPETKPLDDLLADLQRERTSMAVVVDEYGRVAGIVTRRGHHRGGRRRDRRRDRPGRRRGPPAGQRRLVRARPRRDHRPRRLRPDLPVDTDAYNSIGGFVFAELGRLPKRGDTVNANGYSIRVESVRENRIEAVRIRERRTGSRRGRAASGRTIALVRDGRKFADRSVACRPITAPGTSAGARRHRQRAPAAAVKHVRPAGGAGRSCALGGGGCALRR